MVWSYARVEAQAAGLLADLLEVPREEILRTSRSDRGVDLEVKTGGRRIVVQIKRAGNTASVLMAAEEVRARAQDLGREVLPLIAVPYMGDVGRRICSERGVGWFDLSGNANIVGRGLRIHIEGRPNQFKLRGRPSTVFAPKSSRIARCLLLDPQRSFTQRQLAAETGLGEGYVSRLVRRMIEDRLLLHDEEGLIRPSDPANLLDAWGEEYEFTKHRVLRGHVPARSQEELLGTVVAALREAGVQHAATGLAAAWLLTHFATYRITTVFVGSPLEQPLLEKIGFRQDERGANVWLVEPNDEGVFYGVAPQEGVPCVSAVQVYVDLRGHPERAKEAAEELRKQRMPWTRHA